MSALSLPPNKKRASSARGATPKPQSPYHRLIGKTCHIHLLDGQAIEAQVVEVCTYELVVRSCADRKLLITPKHSVLFVRGGVE